MKMADEKGQTFGGKKRKAERKRNRGIPSTKWCRKRRRLKDFKQKLMKRRI